MYEMFWSTLNFPLLSLWHLRNKMILWDRSLLDIFTFLCCERLGRLSLLFLFLMFCYSCGYLWEKNAWNVIRNQNDVISIVGTIMYASFTNFNDYLDILFVIYCWYHQKTVITLENLGCITLGNTSTRTYNLMTECLYPFLRQILIRRPSVLMRFYDKATECF